MPPPWIAIGCLMGRGFGNFPSPQPSPVTNPRWWPKTKMCNCAPNMRLHCRLAISLAYSFLTEVASVDLATYLKSYRVTLSRMNWCWVVVTGEGFVCFMEQRDLSEWVRLNNYRSNSNVTSEQSVDQWVSYQITVFRMKAISLQCY